MRYIRIATGQVYDLQIQENIMVNNGQAFQIVGADNLAPVGQIVEDSDNILDLVRNGDIIEYSQGTKVMKIISFDDTNFYGIGEVVVKTEIDSIWFTVTTIFMRRFAYVNA